jgi:hypothetical protein
MEKKYKWEEPTPPKDQKKVQVRFTSNAILEHMKKLAEEDNRSLNGEIMQALREFINRRESDNL